MPLSPRLWRGGQRGGAILKWLTLGMSEEQEGCTDDTKTPSAPVENEVIRRRPPPARGSELEETGGVPIGQTQGRYLRIGELRPGLLTACSALWQLAPWQR